ncbi:hypothetical protein DFQ27_006064 [Actinomortierella ambigua]|uniref:Probable lysosomal cobalamin transporter n=1 Tax=Actinomortierella ambigua TaxID=1343610 RepID=A0A9P6PXD5_9FUNG|nr:hypothetical protein DFQ27_006064 [Actinomortierella ambigua]
MLEGMFHIIGAWGTFGIMVTILLAVSVFFTYYYADPRDRELFAMSVTILALTVCLSTIALFPVDIFLVSKIMDPSSGLRQPWATDDAIDRMQLAIKIVYAVAYSLIASFCFFWIPLAYFYFEELDETQTVRQRFVAALKYTFFFIAVALMLLLVGLFLKPTEHDDTDFDWIKRLLESLEGTGALFFVVGVVALCGMGVLVFYTAPGLSLLPIYLLAGMKSIPIKVHETHDQLARNREQQNTILNRYPPLSGGPNNNANQKNRSRYQHMSERDRKTLEELQREELVLENRSRMVQGVRDSWLNRCRFLIRPFQVILGISATILTVLLILSISVTVLGKLAGDVCGAPCGYVLSHPEIFNPLNILFLKLSPFFPVDYILMVVIILYLFWATTKGVISIGIRFLWVHLYKFKHANTQPQGLLAATMLLLLSLAALGYTLTMSVAPEYAMFGSQKYCNHTVVDQPRNCADYPQLIIPCHIGAPTDLCTPTVTSTLLLKMLIATPVLGVTFFYLQSLFVIVFVLALLFNLIQGFRHGFGVDPIDEDDTLNWEDASDDILERQGLLSPLASTGARTGTAAALGGPSSTSSGSGLGLGLGTGTGEIAMGEDGRRRAHRRGLIVPGGAQYGAISSSSASSLGSLAGTGTTGGQRVPSARTPYGSSANVLASSASPRTASPQFLARKTSGGVGGRATAAAAPGGGGGGGSGGGSGFSGGARRDSATSGPHIASSISPR